MAGVMRGSAKRFNVAIIIHGDTHFHPFGNKTSVCDSNLKALLHRVKFPFSRQAVLAGVNANHRCMCLLGRESTFSQPCPTFQAALPAEPRSLRPLQGKEPRGSASTTEHLAPSVKAGARIHKDLGLRSPRVVPHLREAVEKTCFCFLKTRDAGAPGFPLEQLLSSLTGSTLKWPRS